MPGEVVVKIGMKNQSYVSFWNDINYAKFICRCFLESINGLIGMFNGEKWKMRKNYFLKKIFLVKLC